MILRSRSGVGLAVVLGLGLGLGLIAACRTRTTDSYRWRQVVVGGGGYVTGVLCHPQVKDKIFIRTDVGGAYALAPDGAQWQPLLDGFARSDWHLYGVESLALHPTDPDILWAALGKYLPRPWLKRPSGVYKSLDGGNTWAATGLAIAVGGNEDYRWVGERLAVDPEHPQVVYFGSRLDGLWQSRDGGIHWQPVTSLPSRGSDEVGLSFIVVGTGGTLYVGVFGEGVFHSADSGKSFRLLAAPRLSRPQRAALATDGALYVAFAGQKNQSGAVARWQGETWRELTPPGKWDYGAIAVDPHNPRIVMAAPSTDDFPTPIFRSQDGGSSWSELAFERVPSVPWWPKRFWTGHTSSLVIDPHDSRRVFYTDYYGTWETRDITKTPSRWQSLSRGHEETEPFILRSPERGAPLLSGMADVDGFRHASLDEYPAARLNGPTAQDGDTTGLDYCQADPNMIVRVGEERGGPYRGARSADGGVTWTRFPALPPAAHNGRIAASALDCQRSVWVPKNAPPFWTADGGASWLPSQGAPPKAVVDRWDYSHPLASDRVDGLLFYLFKDGDFFRSSDGGVSWNKTATLPMATFDPRSGEPGPSVKAARGRRGQVFVCLHHGGLYRSFNAGTTFSRVQRVGLCQIFALGRARAGGPSGPDRTLFVYGNVDGKEGIFRSEDDGQSFIRIDSAAQPIGDQAMVMEGDPRVFGRVYIGTNGRGTFYGEPSVVIARP